MMMLVLDTEDCARILAGLDGARRVCLSAVPARPQAQIDADALKALIQNIKEQTGIAKPVKVHA